jgi:hypothetical protein
MKYRKKPVVVEATQWHTHGDHSEVKPVYTHDINDEHWKPTLLTESGWIGTLEGEMRVSPGDWIITGIKGEHYPCKPDIFEQTYERVEE